MLVAARSGASPTLATAPGARFSAARRSGRPQDGPGRTQGRRRGPRRALPERGTLARRRPRDVALRPVRLGGLRGRAGRRGLWLCGLKLKHHLQAPGPAAAGRAARAGCRAGRRSRGPAVEGRVWRERQRRASSGATPCTLLSARRSAAFSASRRGTSSAARRSACERRARGCRRGVTRWSVCKAASPAGPRLGARAASQRLRAPAMARRGRPARRWPARRLPGLQHPPRS
jgi:hypothetical protein